MLGNMLGLNFSAKKKKNLGLTYFVSETGNDLNAGDILHPFKTIQKALSLVTPGYSIYVRGGIYNEKAFFVSDGLAQAPINLKNFNNEPVVMDGDGVNTGGSALLNTNGCGYIILDGLGVINADAVGIGYTAGSHDIIVKNCSTDHTVNGGIAFYNSNNVIIVDNIVNHANSGNSDEALFVENTSYFEIARNQVLNSGREGIDVMDGSSHGSVHDNVVIGTSLNNLSESRPGIYIDAYSRQQTDIDVYNNIVRDCPHGIFLIAEQGGVLSNVKVHHNLCYKNTAFGMGMLIPAAGYGPLIGIVFFNNTTWDNGNGVESGGGMYISNTGQIASKISIINNLFAEYRVGSYYTPIYGSSHITPDAADFTIAYNLLQKNAGYNNYPGSNFLTGDPLFTNANADIFTLQEGSPALGAGKMFTINPDYSIVVSGVSCNIGAF